VSEEDLSMNLADNLIASAANHPGRVAVKLDAASAAAAAQP
jgi:hypothetical protein